MISAEEIEMPAKKISRTRGSSPAVQKTGPLARAEPETAPVELVFGLVGPIGVDLAAVRHELGRQLRLAGYRAIEIRLSDLIAGFYGKATLHADEFTRVDSLIKDGNALCTDSGRADMVAVLGLTAIRAEREAITGDLNEPSPVERIAYVISSFKRKEEIELFRHVYGKAFNLVSAYASLTSRHAALTRKFKGCEDAELKGFDHEVRPEELASHIIERDYREEREAFGQRVGKAFPLADCFVSTEPRAALESQLKRLVRLTLGDPYISPTREEQGMYFAQAAALQSMDLSRQVGCSIVSKQGDILATGANEVPRFGGGVYYAEDPGCHRDLEYGEDANAAIKSELVQDAIKLLRVNGWLEPKLAEFTDKELTAQALSGDTGFLKKSKLHDVIEFGRALHAEMAAISQAARTGVTIRGARLFCTTFPCHICARHIVATGLTDVYFIEPYEKSRTEELYPDSISVEPHELSATRCNFRAFVGVAPRRYFDFFQITTDRKTDAGKIIDLPVAQRRPKFKRFVFAYTGVEKKFVGDAELPLQQAQAASISRGAAK